MLGREKKGYVDKHDDGTGTMARSKKDSFYWYKKIYRNECGVFIKLIL